MNIRNGYTEHFAGCDMPEIADKEALFLAMHEGSPLRAQWVVFPRELGEVCLLVEVDGTSDHAGLSAILRQLKPCPIAIIEQFPWLFILQPDGHYRFSGDNFDAFLDEAFVAGHDDDSIEEGDISIPSIGTIAVGRPWQGPASTREGPRLEIAEDGSLNLLIFVNDIDRLEMNAFEAGFGSYSFYSTEPYPGVTIASLVFKFPAPISYADTFFHARMYKDDCGSRLLDRPRDNALITCIVDRGIVRLIRESGLQHAAMDLFRKTVRQQMSEQIDAAKYFSAVNRIKDRSSQKEIFMAGKQFKHHGLH